MIDKPNSALRQRMIEDMSSRRFKEKVQKDYLRHVRNFAIFLGRSPDAATAEDVRLYQLHLAEQKIGAPSKNTAVAALRFFFNVTIERPELARHLAGVHKPRRVPVVLSQEEVALLLEAEPGLKYKAAFGVAYGAGLRVSEVVALKVSDKRPFAGPKAVLAYLSRYTHRVAISNSWLVALDDKGVTFKWKDYRIKKGDRLKTMTLDAAEFIRRFLMHVLPIGFHRIRHYGLFASAVRARNIERVHALLAVQTPPQQQPETDDGAGHIDGARKCPCCGGRMIIIETFEGVRPTRPSSPCRFRIDTS